MIRAGAAEIDITPEIGRNVPGQWLRRKAECVHDPLLVNALVLEVEGDRVALVSADVLSLKNRVVAEARNLILDLAGIPPTHVFLAATHTHTGAPVVDALGTEVDPEVLSSFPDALAAAVGRANDQLRPARVASWSGIAPDLAFPRRFHMLDGTVRTHAPKGSRETLNAEDEADPTLTGLHVWDECGELIAACVNFACHPIVVGGASFYSADYPDAVRRCLKRMHGPQATVLYLNGPCGDVGPDNVKDPSRFRYGEEWVDRIGFGIGGHAIGLASLADAGDDLVLTATGERVRLGLRAVPDFYLRKAAKALTDADLATPPQDFDLIRLREYALLDRERREGDTVDAEIAALRIGDTAVVGLPGEIFAAFGRQIRAASPFRHTLVVELANGCHGYVPTRQAFRGGGYETWLARSSKLMPEAGERMVECATALLKEIASTAPRPDQP